MSWHWIPHSYYSCGSPIKCIPPFARMNQFEKGWTYFHEIWLGSFTKINRYIPSFVKIGQTQWTLHTKAFKCLYAPKWLVGVKFTRMRQYCYAVRRLYFPTYYFLWSTAKMWSSCGIVSWNNSRCPWTQGLEVCVRTSLNSIKLSLKYLFRKMQNDNLRLRELFWYKDWDNDLINLIFEKCMVKEKRRSLLTEGLMILNRTLCTSFGHHYTNRDSVASSLRRVRKMKVGWARHAVRLHVSCKAVTFQEHLPHSPGHRYVSETHIFAESRFLKSQ